MRYAAFFRGLNVGGHANVKMQDLRALLEGLGFAGVRTYIQSGNAVFETELPEDECTARICEAFTARFGIDCAVTLRTEEELAGVLRGLPFDAQQMAAAEAADPKVEHVYVYLADGPVPQEELDAMRGRYEGPDLLCEGTREVYLLCHESVRLSKLAALLPRLGRALTARNLRTLQKVHGMMAGGKA